MHQTLVELSSNGSSIVVIGENEHVCGSISLADRVHETFATAIQELKVAGIEPVIMLTGDNEPTAQAIARTAGIDEVRAELLPQDTRSRWWRNW